MNKENNTNQDTFKISGNWDTQSKALKVKFPELTDEDLSHETGHEDALLKRMETRLNKQRDEVIAIIQDIAPASPKVN